MNTRQVHVNPDDLREFGFRIKQFIQGMEELQFHLRKAEAKVSQTWMDVKQTEFAEALNETLKAMERLKSISDTHTRYLEAQAIEIDNFLARRL